MSAQFKILVAALALALSITRASADIFLTGAGATFPNPIYQRWVKECEKAHPTVLIDYQSIGSAGGIKGIIAQAKDFVGTDVLPTPKELQAAKGELLIFPTVGGAIVPAYNIPNLKGELKLTGPVLADIYLGVISKWNDPRIAKLNPDLALPDLAITPIWRTDASGSTYYFSTYISAQSDAFKTAVGAGKAVKWPVGDGGKGSPTAWLQETKGGIAYLDLTFAIENKIPFASVRNREGKFIKASPASVSAAGAAAIPAMKKTLAIEIIDQPGEDSYPIAAFTYIMIYKDLGYMKDLGKARVLMNFLNWAITDGQKLAADMQYAPLAPEVQKKIKEALDAVTYDGKPINEQ